MEKEHIKIVSDTKYSILVNLYKKGDKIEYKNETYSFVQRSLIEGDGECHDVVVKRKSDGKFFSFGTSYSDGINYYDDTLVEVKPKKVTKIEYE